MKWVKNVSNMKLTITVMGIMPLYTLTVAKKQLMNSIVKQSLLMIFFVTLSFVAKNQDQGVVLMLNRVVLDGRLTRDPDLRYTPNGVAVANFTLAVNRPFTNQQGDRDADFINCVAWRRQAENLANYMKKGSQIGVDGRLQSRSYEDQDGKRVYVTEVVSDSVQFLEPRSNTQERRQDTSGLQHGNFQQGQRQPTSPLQQSSDVFKSEGEPIDISDDDLPF